MGSPILSDSLRSLMDENRDRCAVSRLILGMPWMTTDQEINYLTLRNGMLTYLPAGKVQERTEAGRWSREGRQEGKPAKAIRRVITREAMESGYVTDRDFERFANLVKGDAERLEGEFRVVEGYDISHWYQGWLYAERTGSLENSCMRYPYCQSYLRVYAEHPEFIKMLIKVNAGGELMGRALVWEDHDRGANCMDRVYGADHMIEAFKDEALDRGWFVRKCDEDGDFDGWEDRNGREVHDLTFTLKREDYEAMPYMDSLKFFRRNGDGTATLSSSHGGAGFIELTGTHGDNHPGFFPTCGYCAQRLGAGVTVHHDQYGTVHRSCFDRHLALVPCDECAREVQRGVMRRGLCNECWNRRYVRTCVRCGDLFVVDDLDAPPSFDGRILCRYCAGVERRERERAERDAMRPPFGPGSYDGCDCEACVRYREARERGRVAEEGRRGRGERARMEVIDDTSRRGVTMEQMEEAMRRLWDAVGR
jgi:hypothetical protein